VIKPIAAIASSPAIREMALLIAEATPAWRLSILARTAEVRVPPSSTAHAEQYDAGEDSGPVSYDDVTRSISKKPNPATIGPVAINKRGPYLPAKAPKRGITRT